MTPPAQHTAARAAGAGGPPERVPSTGPAEGPETNAPYWVRRHEEMQGDIRAVGNRGRTVEDNLADYALKERTLNAILEAEGRSFHGGAAIDLGCGFANLGPALLSMGLSYTGVDVSPVALDQARVRCPDGVFVEADLLEYQPDRSYDVVVISAVLCHFIANSAWHRGIALIASALAPDGIAIIFDTIPEQERISYEDYVLCRTWNEYTAAFGEAGLVISPTPQSAKAYLARHAGARASAAERSSSGRAALAGEAKEAAENKPTEEGPAAPPPETDGPREKPAEDGQAKQELASDHGHKESRDADVAGAKPKTAPTPEEVYAVVRGYPHMSFEDGRIFYEFIRTHNLRRVLELGFNHGVSTCYLAAAVASLGGGHVVTIDRAQAAAYEPGLEHFLERLGLGDLVAPFYEATTYNWRLRDFLRMDPRPSFDVVFLDGAHIFEPDALAFLLAEKLLRPGGWMVFDDINWSIATSPTATRQRQGASLPPDELHSMQIREVVDVLVRGHPNIADWREDRKWGYARKKSDEELASEEQLKARLLAAAAVTKRRGLEIFPVPIEIPPDLNPVDWKSTLNKGLARNAEARRKTLEPSR